jgi:hypothetical protein
MHEAAAGLEAARRSSTKVVGDSLMRLKTPRRSIELALKRLREIVS